MEPPEPQEPRSQDEAKRGTSRIEFRYVTRDQKIDPHGAAAMGEKGQSKGRRLDNSSIATLFESRLLA